MPDLDEAADRELARVIGALESRAGRLPAGALLVVVWDVPGDASVSIYGPASQSAQGVVDVLRTLRSVANVAVPTVETVVA